MEATVIAQGRGGRRDNRPVPMDKFGHFLYPYEKKKHCTSLMQFYKYKMAT
jgi:hypothetical protein